MKRLWLRILYFFLISFFYFQLSPLLQAEVPRLEPLNSVALLAKAKEPLKIDELIAASLILSGVEDNRLQTLKKMFYVKIDEVKAHFKGRGVSPELGDDLLRYIHNQYLGRYNVKQTRVDELLEKGTYNCVSSAVFFLIVSRSLGFSTYGVKTTDHSFCAIQVGENTYDVETTSVYGFNPGEKKEFTDDFGKVTGYAYVPPGNYSAREIIGEKELLFLILHNRAVVSFDKKQYADAVSIAVDGYELIKNDLSLVLLLQAFAHYTTWVVSSKQFQSGAEVLRKASSRYNRQKKLKEYYSHIITQWVVSYIDEAEFNLAQVLIFSSYKDKTIDNDTYRELFVYLHQKKAEYFAKRDGNKSALEIIDQGLGMFHDEQSLIQSKTLYTYNYIVELITEGDVELASSVLIRTKAEAQFKEKDYNELFAFLYQKKAELAFSAEGVEAALEQLEEGMNEVADKTLMLQLGEMYLFNHIKALIKNGEFSQAADNINGQYASVFLSQKSKQDLLLYFYLTKAESLSDSAGFLAAAHCIREGMSSIGKHSHLVQNYEVYIHNHVAELAGRKEYAQALAVLEQALTVLPASSVFKKDKRVIEDNMN
ncbi:MAG: hypothetical protein JW822_06455 [Spirochaetales bacterium]|nr:hypothetical protein [Spirochaetales bacterium]